MRVEKIFPVGDSRISRYHRLRSDPLGYFVAMALAGAIYPLLVFALVEGRQIQFSYPLVAGLLVTAVVGAGVGAMIGMGSLVCGRALQWTLAAEADRTRSYTFAGGLAGLLVLSLYLLLWPHPPVNHNQMADAGLVLLFGPGLATPLFQFAAACGEWPAEGPLPRPGRWQFGMRQILSAMVWIALGLTLLKLTGRLTSWVVMWITVWGVYQGITMWLVLRLCGWRRGGFSKGDWEMMGGRANEPVAGPTL